MKTTEVGQAAEAAVAQELERTGYQIIARNWKTKVCELDIVAKKDEVIYFVEVKYRSGLAQGSGLEYIGPQKLKKIHFGAQVWLQTYKWEDDYSLVVASVSGSGSHFVIDEIIEFV